MTIDCTPQNSQMSAGRHVKSGIWWIALAAVGCVAFFWDGIVSLINAWSRPEYSHGPLIPLIAMYLLLRELRNEPAIIDSSSRTPGLLVVAFGVLIGLVGNLTQIPYFITYGLIIVIGGIILLVAGAKNGVRFWVPWIYLIFMLPLPTAAYWLLSTKLQFISSQLGVAVIQGIGIPVYLDGNVIDLGVYKLQVAEACSGLRYLFPLASFGFLFATLYRGPAWQKVILFLSSVPITIFMNSFRIGVIGILVSYFGTAQAEGFLHLFEGWIIFVACIALLYLEAVILQLFLPKRQALSNILDLDFSGIMAPLRQSGSVVPHKKLVAGALLLLVVGAIWQLSPPRSAPLVSREPLAAFPMQIGSWGGQFERRLDPNIEQVLGADDYLTADYAEPNGQATINLFIAFYNSTTDGTGIHSPQVCLPGGGWEISDLRQMSISNGDPSAPPFELNRVVIERGRSKQLVYYWFEMRGRRLPGEYEAKFYTIWDSLIKFRADGALVRFVTPIENGEAESAADARLTTFLPSVLKVLPRFIPQ